MTAVSRRRFVLGTSGLAAAQRSGRRPNVIVVLADDLGSADLGFQGAVDIPTPHLDELARGGVRFTHACVSHPFCSPTRAGLMTGRYQQRFGHENNPVFDRNDEVSGLPVTEITLPQVMKQAGYVTGMVGKWHLGAAPKFHPLRRGFDEMFGFLGGGHDYHKAGVAGETREYLIPIERDGKPVVETEYLTDALSREAAGFVRRHERNPFFLYVAYNAPHTPLQPVEKYLERVRGITDEKRRNYAAMVASVDDGVGRLMTVLRGAKIERDTLVFFLSDNGGPVSVTNSSNHPLRGAKGGVYEGGFRTPFLMHWPGRLKPGTVRDGLTSSLDILPTAAGVAGAVVPNDRPIDGVDLMPYASGAVETAPHQRLFWRTGGGTSGAVREGPHKLVVARERAGELYDLEADPGESRDLAAEQPALAARLRTTYDEWSAQMVAPVFRGPQQAGARKEKG